MKLRIAKKLAFGALVLLVGTAVPAGAQDLSVGYQYQHFSGGSGTSVPLGFNVDVTFPVSGPLAVVGGLDWSRKSESVSIPGLVNVDASSSFTTFGGGVRWNAAMTNSVSPFVQALIGATRSGFKESGTGLDISDSSTDMMFDVGAGAGFPLSGNIDGVGQIDYRRIFSEGDGTNGFRFVAGVRIKLKK